MLKPRFLVLLIIVTMTFCGCIIEIGERSYLKGSESPYLKIVNQYHRPINEITIFKITAADSRTYNYFGNLNITKGNSGTFDIYGNNAFEADIKVSFGSEYDIKQVSFSAGKTTTVTLNENGILE